MSPRPRGPLDSGAVIRTRGAWDFLTLETGVTFQVSPGLVALALGPIGIFWAPASLLQMDFQPKRALYWRGEFCHVLAMSKRPGIATASGNLVVTDL